MRSLLLAGVVVFGCVGTAEATTIAYTGAITSYTVQTSGTYDIVAFGAQGGGNGNSLGQGGLGAKAEGLFNLTAGQVLMVLVGGQGSGFNTYSYSGGGGGGGSFVVDASNNPLAVAGGGGGAGGYSNQSGGSGKSGTAGGNADFTGYHGTGGTGGAGGTGGTAPGVGNGSGGGGLSGSGTGRRLA